ncbi:sensor domain-containing protein [Streptomyces carpaticus]|uniref:sensor domain-containing protein n=1 Tax=Streptomyces carpaticus TaxID=285558 RepID=UPI00220A9C76|nr:sensor domain-containing protein [Streptomyces carpaticus]
MSYSTPPAAGRFRRELSYLLRGLPVGIVAFTVAVTGFALGLGTLVIVGGIPVLAGTLRAARGMARVERRELEALAGRPLPPHHYRTTGGTGLGRVVRSLAEPQSWRDLAHMVLALPLRVAGFCLAVVWTVGGVGGVLFVAWGWALPRGEGHQGLLELMTGNDSYAGEAVFMTAVGALLLATSMPVVRGMVALNRSLAGVLLTNRTAAHRAAVAAAARTGTATASAGTAGTTATAGADATTGTAGADATTGFAGTDATVPVPAPATV